LHPLRRDEAETRSVGRNRVFAIVVSIVVRRDYGITVISVFAEDGAMMTGRGPFLRGTARGKTLRATL